MKRMTSLSKISRKLLKPFRGKESGMAFIAVLAFLVLGALIITPLLGFMITGLKAGQTHESRTQEFYSADAGIQYAIWQLQYGPLLEDDFDWVANNPYNVTEEANGGPLLINNDLVDVLIENINLEGKVFKVTSTATDTATGSATRVTAHVSPAIGYQGNFFANGVTGAGDVVLRNVPLVEGNVEVAGKLTVPPKTTIIGDVTCDELENKGEIYGNVKTRYLNNNSGLIQGQVEACDWNSLLGTIIPGGIPQRVCPGPDMSYLNDDDGIWPKKEYLDAFYLEQVTDDPEDPLTYYPYVLVSNRPTVNIVDSTILQVDDYYKPSLIDNYKGLFTGYTSSDASVNLRFNVSDSDKVVRLTKTVFVTGNLDIVGKTTLDLFGQTIYVQGNLTVGTQTTMMGSGVIIVIGDINFQPNVPVGGSGSPEAVILHYGSTLKWERQANPSYGDLYDVCGFSDTQVYAVGYGGQVLRYDGSAWSTVTTPLSGLTVRPILNGVWCNSATGDIFAVGNSGTTLRYDASTAAWTYEVHGTADLMDVWGSTTDNIVYAVGEGGVTWRWEDGVWSEMVNNWPVTLNAVWGSEDDGVVFAVGMGGTMRQCTDGETWVYRDSGTTRHINAIWGVSADDFYVAGEEGYLRRYRNGAWGLPMTIDTSIKPNLRGIWGSSVSDVWAVGEQGVIVHYSGSGLVWTEQDPGMPQYKPTTRNLNAIWGSRADDIFVVGQSQQDFVFIQSVTGTAYVAPNGPWSGSIAGKSDVTLQPGGNLMGPSDLGRMNFPQYRYMYMQGYIIEQL